MLGLNERGVSNSTLAAILSIMLVAGILSYLYLSSPQSAKSTSYYTTTQNTATSPSLMTSTQKAENTTQIKETTSNSSTTSKTTLECINFNQLPSDYVKPFMLILSAYREFGFELRKGSTNSSFSATLSYERIYHSTGVYKIAFLFGIKDVITGANERENSTLWVLDNGTVLALLANGNNESGSIANQDGKQYMSLFLTWVLMSNVTRAMQSFIHVNSTENVTITGTTLHSKKYVANKLPFTATVCGQSGSFTFTQFSIQTAVLPNTSLEIAISLNWSGYSGTNNQTSNFSFLVNLLSS